MNSTQSSSDKLSTSPSPSRARGPRSSRRRPLGLVLGIAFLTGLTHFTQAATTTATGTISASAPVGGLYDYTVTLDNTGTTPIQTLWFAWIPGQDYLATRPTNITSPTGWTANITGGSANDGFAIQWLTSTPGDALAAGSTFASFSFTSTDTPAQIAGNSSFFPTTPVGTSFVYQGTPFSGGSEQFVVASVPEPSTYAVIGAGLLGLCGWRRVKARVNS